LEQWEDVVGAEEYYQISSFGRIKNKITGDILKPSKSCGYYHIKLCYGINKDMLIHRLVAQAFLPNPFNYQCVNHKDEDKTNNHIDNLEWCTHHYNSNYGIGALQRNQKVIQYDMQGNALKIYDSMKQAGEELGIKYQGISACCRGKNKSYGGYAWTYANIVDVKKRWKNKK
jgi:hypothetical protein